MITKLQNPCSKTLLNYVLIFFTVERSNVFVFVSSSTTRRILVGFKDFDVIAENLKGRSEGLGLCRFSACMAFKPQKSKVYLT